MCQVSIQRENVRRQVIGKSGALLSDILRREEPLFAMPCAGNHTCGKCVVRVSGAVSPPTEAEASLLGAASLERGLRLACSCRLEGDAAVFIPQDGKGAVITWSETPAFSRTETGFGLAVDIGTTTVAMRLYNRESGEILAENLALNAQRGFGADVISRISACEAEGVEALSSRINTQLEEMGADCLHRAGIRQIEESAVTGNTTMLHLYEGLDPASLAVAPFHVQSHFGCVSRRTLAGAPVYLPRCVGAYVGADIVCAILASGLLEGGVQILADIGTNGEMALVRDGKLVCCATAAGPAFEGAGLSCGMPAVPGAICGVTWGENGLSFKTIGDALPKGICGSGILDALAVMLENEVMEDTGYMDEDFQIGSSEVFITKRDVRQIQLAKSAICAGLMTLIEATDISPEKVRCFSIAGGFGSHMNLRSACVIGLLPSSLTEKSRFIGNAALGGASMMLMNRALRKESEQIARHAVEISLSSNPRFMDHYVDCMSFEEFA